MISIIGGKAMSLLTKDQLIAAYDDILLLEALEYKASNIVTLTIDNVKEFIELARKLNSKQIFYNYLYYDIDNYLLPEQLYDEHSIDIKAEVRKHNEIVNSLDFNKPGSLTLIFLIDGVALEVTLYDFWIEEMEVPKQEVKHEEIVNNYLDEFKMKQREMNQQEDEEKEKLKAIILEDDDFKYMKNQRLRQEYLYELLSKDKFQKYHYLFEGKFNRGISIPIKDFMDRIWIEFRNQQKNK